MPVVPVWLFQSLFVQYVLKILKMISGNTGDEAVWVQGQRRGNIQEIGCSEVKAYSYFLN